MAIALKRPTREDVWRFHPRSRPTELARHPLGEGRTLVLGRDGRRWIENTEGVEEFAAHLVADSPEGRLTSIVLVGGRWIYTTDQGIAYGADTPLGTFRTVHRPREPLSVVRGSGGLLLGIRSTGGLSRSLDGGRSWQALDLPTRHFVAVAVKPDGSSLTIGAPEQLWSSSSAAMNWLRLTAAPIGAKTVEVLDDKFIVTGALSTFAVGADRKLHAFEKPKQVIDLPFTDAARQRHYRHATEDLARLPLGPSAAALREGRAVLEQKRYLEVAPLAAGGDAWVLLQGAPTSKLATRQLPELSKCEDARIAAFDRWVYLACSPRGGGHWQFWRSEDGGQTFAREPYMARTPPRYLPHELQMVTARDGTLIVSGMCETIDINCLQRGIFFRGPVNEAQKRKRRTEIERRYKDAPYPRPVRLPTTRAVPATVDLEPAEVHGMRFPSGVSMSKDGLLIYAVGQLESETPAVFVSKDDGRHFSQVPQSEPLPSWSGAIRVLGAAHSDGSTAFVLESVPGFRVPPSEQQVLIVSRDGRLLRHVQAPFAGAELGAVGSRVLAVDPQRTLARESLDAGQTWQDVKLPPGLCSRGRACDTTVYCSEALCVFGTDLSRKGWGPDADSELPAAILPPPPQPPSVGRRGLTCTVNPAGWRPLRGLIGMPTAAEAALGSDTWSMPAIDGVRGAASVVAARRGSTAPTYRPLLEPMPKDKAHHVFARQQVGGVVAWRFPVHPSRDWKVARPVEIAWRVVDSDRVQRANFADPAPTGTPDVLRVGAEGVYLGFDAKMHTWFSDGGAVSGIPPTPWPAGVRDYEFVRSGATHVPLALRNGALLRAHVLRGQWSFDAMTIGPSPPIGSVEFARRGTTPGFYARWPGTGADGLFYPLSTSELAAVARTAVQTRLDTTVFTACTTEQRKSWLRVVVSEQRAPAHAIRVLERGDARAFETSRAVLYVSREAACVAATEAYMRKGETAILPWADLAHSFLFRWGTTEEGARRPKGQGPWTVTTPVVQYRTMSCKRP